MPMGIPLAPQSGEFRYRKALILGGSRGLGLELAKGCLLRGCNEIISVSSSIPERESERVRTFQVDLRDSREVQEFAAYLERDPSMADIDLFCWVAGCLTRRLFADLTRAKIRQMLDVNLNGPLIIANAVWARMQMARLPTHFVVVSSSSGTKARPEETVYVAAKHAQVGFTRSLALESKDPNLRILLVTPGGMRTSFWDAGQPPDYDSFLDPEKVAQKILTTVQEQQEPFLELSIPRGSL